MLLQELISFWEILQLHFNLATNFWISESIPPLEQNMITQFPFLAWLRSSFTKSSSRGMYLVLTSESPLALTIKGPVTLWRPFKSFSLSMNKASTLSNTVLSFFRIVGSLNIDACGSKTTTRRFLYSSLTASIEALSRDGCWAKSFITTRFLSL